MAAGDERQRLVRDHALEGRAPEDDRRRVRVEEPEPRRVVRVLEHGRRLEAEHALRVVERLRHRVRLRRRGRRGSSRLVAERLERLGARADDRRLDEREDARDERIGVLVREARRPVVLVEDGLRRRGVVAAVAAVEALLVGLGEVAGR